MTVHLSFDCPVLGSATVNGATLTLTYSPSDDALDTNSLPLADDFVVKVDDIEVDLATTNPVGSAAERSP